MWKGLCRSCLRNETIALNTVGMHLGFLCWQTDLIVLLCEAASHQQELFSYSQSINKKEVQKSHNCVFFFFGKDRLMCFILKGLAGGQRLIIGSLTFLQHVSAGSRQSLEASGLFVKLVSLVSSLAAPLCLSPINDPSLLSFWRCPRPPCPHFFAVIRMLLKTGKCSGVKMSARCLLWTHCCWAVFKWRS